MTEVSGGLYPVFVSVQYNSLKTDDETFLCDSTQFSLQLLLTLTWTIQRNYWETFALLFVKLAQLNEILFLTLFEVIIPALFLTFVRVFQRNWNKIYSCLNFETKVCKSSRTVENTILQFGKKALQLFSFFLFLQIFAYCHEAMKFMMLIWNASLLAEKQLDFLAIIYSVFSFLPLCCKF